MTSLNSKQLEKESNVFFMVLMATYSRLVRAILMARLRPITYQCAATGNMRSCGSNTCKGDASEAAITNFLHHLIPLFQRSPAMWLYLCVGVHCDVL